MAKIFLVSIIGMEPYTDYGSGPSKAFMTKEAAEKFIKEHDQVYDEGYFRWDDDTNTRIPCDENDDEAAFEYGWKYSTHIDEIELVEDK